jgi:hypothetical protein
MMYKPTFVIKCSVAYFQLMSRINGMIVRRLLKDMCLHVYVIVRLSLSWYKYPPKARDILLISGSILPLTLKYLSTTLSPNKPA